MGVQGEGRADPHDEWCQARFVRSSGDQLGECRLRTRLRHLDATPGAPCTCTHDEPQRQQPQDEGRNRRSLATEVRKQSLN